MAFDEDLALFLDADAGFADEATLDDEPIEVIFDTEGVDPFGTAIEAPTALAKAADIDSIEAIGAELVIASGRGEGTYKVRTVAPEPPDGAFMRLTLAKVEA